MESDTIAAISTPAGCGGLAVIRISGKDAFEIGDKLWRGSSLRQAESHTVHLGDIIGSRGELLDRAVATVYHEGRSFTGENTVEFSIHGSRWIQREVMARLVESGARAAGPGEFTKRAFVNGRLDLAQAEGVADMIASESRAAHRLAASQMKGEFSAKLDEVRKDLIQLASLIELELDFSEEEVEFADRHRLLELCNSTIEAIGRLGDTFRTGQALKEGVAAVIAGIPNAGKSTLLNRLVGDEKAIVSEIPGTTRDIIEDKAEIDGILFRFIDTAGLRESEDEIEKIGISRAREKMRKARIIIWLIDPSEALDVQINMLEKSCGDSDDVQVLTVVNKTDSQENIEKAEELIPKIEGIANNVSPLMISAKTGEGLEELKGSLVKMVGGNIMEGDMVVVSNIRHYEALMRTAEALRRVREGLTEGISGDFIAQDLREAIHHLGEITGAITTDTLLHSIFSSFCIGK